MTEIIETALAARVGARLRQARQERGITLTALAQESGISRRMLTQIEQGQANPSIALLDRVAATLDTGLADLVGATGGDHPTGVQVWSSPAGSWGMLLTALPISGTTVEFWKCRLAAGDARTFTAGAAGQEAAHHVLTGTLHIITEDNTVTAGSGESVSVPLGQTRQYVAVDNHEAVFFLLFPQPAAPVPAGPTPRAGTTADQSAAAALEADSCGQWWDCPSGIGEAY